jgi:hypothetical protein
LLCADVLRPVEDYEILEQSVEDKRLIGLDISEDKQLAVSALKPVTSFVF